MKPQRTDIGDLIVLTLSGTYREMGRQHVDLLGQTARDVYEFQRADWARLMASFGAAAKAAEAVLPRFWMSLWRHFEGSGAYETIAGMADGLGVSLPDAWRGVFGFLGSGTTTFVATRSATAGAGAIMGKNSDWSDSNGLRPPVVTICHPTNGDFAVVGAGWPLLPFPHTAVNEAGLALGINFFTADQVLALGRARWPNATALQRARTVAEALSTFERSQPRGLSGFTSLADAAGDLAMVEYTPARCGVFRPEGDWFAQTNHARTDGMIPYDRGRSLDSFQRLAAMEAAVRPHLGAITPAIAAGILRDRSNSPYVNESTVANTSVLNSTVVDTASRTLWHSTLRQPLAPFGEMVPFSLSGDAPAQAPLPADARVGAQAFREEADAIGEIRRASALFDSGRVAEAGAVWDRLAERALPYIEPRRLLWARARVHWTLGRLEDADGMLAGLATPETPFDVCAHALAMRAVIADRLGRRADAVRLYNETARYLDRHPQYDDQLTVRPLRARIAAGLAAPHADGPLPATPGLQRVA